MEGQKILALAGRKQSGKNTAANFIVGLEMMSLAIVRGGFLIDELGQLNISDLFGDTEYEGHLDLSRSNPEFIDFLNEHISPYVKLYSFADLLKKEVCIKILGLTHDQCFGTDADKNTLTHLEWRDMPGISCEIPEVNAEWYGGEHLSTVAGRMGRYYEKHGITGVAYHAPGPMTAREVLQYVGTEVFRRMYKNVWVDATIRQIKEEGSMYAIITDCRFPNEVLGIQEAGGKVIRLTRNPAGDKDVHESERALDRDRFDWDNFDAIIDNEAMDINTQNDATLTLLNEWGWAPEVKDTI